MIKKKVILGLLIAIVSVVACIFLGNKQPYVFAAEIPKPEIETVTNEAGTFSGQGYYVVGNIVNLEAKMNLGYAFDGWYLVEGESETLLSANEVFNDFIINCNASIIYKYHQIEYSVQFADDLYTNESETSLNDFTYQIVNKTKEGNPYYYGNQIEITFNIKDDRYIYDLNNQNIMIDNVSIYDIIRTDNPMVVDCNIINNDITGFRQFVITLNIKEDILIDIDYTYMYQLKILSGNSIPVSEIIQFVTLTNYYSLLDNDNYIYLIRADKQVLITNNPGNTVYEFKINRFNGQDPTSLYSQAFTINKNSTFTVTYNKKDYSINFNSYLVNIYGERDLMTIPLYDIQPVSVKAGDSVSFEYDTITKNIAITDIEDGNSIIYQYPENTYGYRFMGFAIDGVITVDTTYTLSATEPTDFEIQLIFEYIEYNFEIKLANNCSTNDVIYNYSYNNDSNKLVRGTQIKLNATSNKYTIVGWSWKSIPENNDDYINIAETAATSSEYAFIFIPISDDNSQIYTIYLDIDYKYLTATYNLKSNSIVQNVDYDEVIIDSNDTNKTITFKDSENKKTELVIMYTDSDVTTEDSKTIINTDDFGNIEIDGDILSYVVDSIKVSSVAKSEELGKQIYTFDKYTYFGELQVSNIEYVTLTEDGENVTVGLGGTTFTYDTQTSGEIQTLTTTKTYNATQDIYIIDFYGYTINLYMNKSDEYDHITFNGVTYYYNGTRFEIYNEIQKSPKEVKIDDEFTKKDSSYSIQLKNLLPDALLLYSTKTTNPINYEFTTFTNQIGSSLWDFEYNGYESCILDVKTISIVNVAYRTLSNNIELLINNENAYQYSNILFTIDGEEGLISGTGNIISAKDNDEITITIVQENINNGYKFGNYLFNDEIKTDDENPLVLKFTMDSRTYAGQVIIIEFEAIEYTININYIDNEGNVITQAEANGGLRLQGQSDFVSSYIVDLSNEYMFEAIANPGYYVGRAFVGTSTDLNGLISNNENESLITNWKLNINNFEQVIIDNAGDGTEVNLYIYFAIHTYSIKVYFEISENASRVIYPIMYIDGVMQSLDSEKETVEEITITKRFVQANDFHYGSYNILLQLDNFMVGTTISQWSDAKGMKVADATTQYTLTEIKQNIVLKVVLKYVKYSLEFEIVDDEGQKCNYGSVIASSTMVGLFDTINYNVNTELGYVLKEKYHYNSSNEIKNEEIDSGFTFYPSRFKIENGATVKIYLVFTLKAINLTIGNSIDGSKQYFENIEVSDMASYTVSRQRDGVIEELNLEDSYEFQKDDMLIMRITPMSIGIEVSNITLNNVYFIDNKESLLHNSSYSANIVSITDENDKITGVYYLIKIEFTAKLISGLTDIVALQNVLKVKTFNINYTYNYIEYDFDIRLTRKYGGSTATGGEDEEMLINSVGFGKEITFSYQYKGMTTGEAANFDVDGYSVSGIRQEAIKLNPNSKNYVFVFNDIQLWEEVALKMSSEILVVLILKPKITLENSSEYSEETGYLYERLYIGEAQGLIDGVDVIVGGNFKIIIQYSSDSGAFYTDERPIDVGKYDVKIIAKIISDDSTITEVEFEEKVVYSITPSPITISLKSYNAENPIIKTYDGTNNVSEQNLVQDILLNGVYTRDIGNIYIDVSRLSAEFTEVVVNPTAELYDIKVFDIYLIDGEGNLIKNYIISSVNYDPNRELLILENIGKINPQELKITGFTVDNKVYDATNEVKVNLEMINFIGKVENDSAPILTENLKFYLEDYSVGKGREVFIDWSEALIGADSSNYTIIYDKTTINIHPYEISYTLQDYGTFKVVDVDRQCLIPIGSRIIANVYDRGSSEYRSLYSTIETKMNQDEKLKFCYEIIMQVGAVNEIVPEGLYLYIPKTSKVTKVLQVLKDQEAQSLEILPQSDYTIVKLQKGQVMLGVIVRATYLPLWIIILIVILVAAVIGVVVALFVIIRRKTKEKYSAYDKI